MSDDGDWRLRSTAQNIHLTLMVIAALLAGNAFLLWRILDTLEG